MVLYFGSSRVPRSFLIHGNILLSCIEPFSFCGQAQAFVAGEENGVLGLCPKCHEGGGELKGIGGPQRMHAEQTNRPVPHHAGRLHLIPVE